MNTEELDNVANNFLLLGEKEMDISDYEIRIIIPQFMDSREYIGIPMEFSIYKIEDDAYMLHYNNWSSIIGFSMNSCDRIYRLTYDYIIGQKLDMFSIMAWYYAYQYYRYGRVLNYDEAMRIAENIVYIGDKECNISRIPQEKLDPNLKHIGFVSRYIMRKWDLKK